ncbi:MAG TPA: LssY C-terminal domain-containing protein [Candidatus Sulfotelmatobacter sp.]|nr:LssY C-terminal domain-containing protein [Candidatus Sulfotelmatobacter sp.]
MIQTAVRFAKRAAIFLPGIFIAYISFEYTLPYFHKRSPIIIAILLTYALAAYVLIPAIMRLFRIIFPPSHLPLYCITPDGLASDPLNIGLVCSRMELISTMTKTGWNLADRHSPRNTTRHVLAILLGMSYVNAPVSSLYLFGRKHDLAFTIPINGTNFRRHHVRFWATTYTKNKPLAARTIHWENQKAHVQSDQLLWVGAASLDTGLMPIRHNLQVSHTVHPDTNLERELIVNKLKDSDLVKKVEKIKLDNPYKLVNRTWRSELITDGMMKVVWLK